jgi:hypothetical protein
MFSIFWLSIVIAGFQLRPSPRPDPVPAPASIQGIVIRSGAAAITARRELPNARVELKPGNVSVFTGADGTFTFRNIPSGRYTIAVTREGFIPQEDRRHGLAPSGLGVTLSPGQTLKDVVLPMIPAPVITGKVFDPYGAPLAAGAVRAYQRQYTPYGTQLRIVRKGMTNDMGEFRLFGLNFGEYLVSAGYGDRERGSVIGRVQLSANVARADDGYSTIFYDGTEDISRAQAAHLGPGSDPAPLNIYLRDPARFRIRGRVLPVLGGTKIILAPKGSDLTEPDYFTEPDGSGAFEMRGVSPGAYVLLATAADGGASSDVIAVNVTDTDIDGVRLALKETISIYGRVFWEGGPRANLSGLHVRLSRSSVEFDQRIQAPVASDGAFTLEHVVPLADYDIVVDPLPAGVYVKSISSGGHNILPGKLPLLPGQPLQILLATATDGLEIHVTSGPDPAPGIQVVLIPDALLRRRADRYIIGFTGESGDLRFTTVPPGPYTAYAFEKIEPGAYYALAHNPAAGDRFRDRAVAVTVGDGGTRAIELRVIPSAETAGGFE